MSTQWLKPNFDNMLPELKRVPNWVLAKAVMKKGKITKPPFQPNGKIASHSDPDTWSAFDAVKEAYEPGRYIGVGFVLDGKPHFDGQYLHGFDWDKCIIDGKIDETVLAELEKLNITRREISVSGKGIRGWFLHNEPLTSCKTTRDGRSVELYSNQRYLTTTGVGEGVLE